MRSSSVRTLFAAALAATLVTTHAVTPARAREAVPHDVKELPQTTKLPKAIKV